ncbi:MAG: death on curing protein [Alphaproteobacteria bacterium]|nr:MAG: death on curing protein [Caulobacteraceae bacterium]TPW05256.1 MAG: death on curing protein [Alphaproteobacteria bacterium]
MSAPVWLETAAVARMHMDQLAEHGGGLGLRDAGLLDSAMAPAKNLHAYGETDLIVLATAYASGIVRNHPFIDGNKRTGFLAAYVFLAVNGFEIVADEPDVVVTMLALAAGELSDEAFTGWLRAVVTPMAAGP